MDTARNAPLSAVRRLVESAPFHRAVIGIILANALLIGLETSRAVMDAHGPALRAANAVVVALFVVEIALRLVAAWPRPLAFFRDGWNVFDFAVVAASLLPESGAFATVARLARVLRAGRLVSARPDLRLIIGTMLRSVRSMGHVLVLLGLLLYVYGVLGYHLFGAAAPQHWGTLGRALATLFQVLTLEGWNEIQAATSTAHPADWLFYVSFIFLAVFVVTNLFIAVVINNLEAAKREEQRRHQHDDDPRRHLEALREQLAALEAALERSGGGAR